MCWIQGDKKDGVGCSLGVLISEFSAPVFQVLVQPFFYLKREVVSVLGVLYSSLIRDSLFTVLI